MRGRALSRWAPPTRRRAGGRPPSRPTCSRRRRCGGRQGPDGHESGRAQAELERILGLLRYRLFCLRRKGLCNANVTVGYLTYSLVFLFWGPGARLRTGGGATAETSILLRPGRNLSLPRTESRDSDTFLALTMLSPPFCTRLVLFCVPPPRAPGEPAYLSDNHQGMGRWGKVLLPPSPCGDTADEGKQGHPRLLQCEGGRC